MSKTEFEMLTGQWMEESVRQRYSYGFTWLGRPVIQYPQDLIALQELIWAVKPDLIIETGIAHGGSLVFTASVLELNAACGGPNNAAVIGIDVDIRQHNRAAIEAHPLSKRIQMVEGSSLDSNVINNVKSIAASRENILVCLDSNHTEEHVLGELDAYGLLTSVGSCCIVFDTVIEDLPAELHRDRPWGPGNNPKTAVENWCLSHPEFVVLHEIDTRLRISAAPGGYLRRIR